MAIGVHTDCTTPALVNFGSEKLKRTYLAPAIAGDMVTSLAVSEPGGGSDVASIKTTATRLAAGMKIFVFINLPKTRKIFVKLLKKTKYINQER